MALAAGTKLGAYEITAPLGKGGMGEVYRALDTRLDRDVAIKVLPPAVANDPERVARFEREAKLLATLNHPNIAQIYGLEESANQKFLVLEYIEGETLAARVKRGAINFADSLEIARQIAEALETAHDSGVIHRDLKPGNVMIRADGTVKVLDFGLARAVSTDSSTLGSALGAAASNQHSPTITADFTRPGVVLGTAAYMSPEQARGLPLDKRTDIWSFGVILYECLTGVTLFKGETATDSIGAILHKSINLENLPTEASPILRHVLQRCLERDRKLRLRDIGDARIDLATASSAPSFSGLHKAAKPNRSAIALITLVVAIAGTVVTWTIVRQPADSDRQPVRLRMALDKALDFSGYAYRMLAISPDGSKVVYSAGGGGTTHLYVRRLDTFGSELIPGTEGGRSPFFSPDGKRVGFFARGLLKWVSLSGGAPLTFSAVPGLHYGGDWLPDGRIIYASNVEAYPLIVSANGGKPEPFPITPFKGQTGAYRWPRTLPDGKHFLITFSGTLAGLEGPHVLVVSLESGHARRLARGSDAQYVHPGFLLIGQDIEALVAKFDPKSLTLAESPRAIGLKAATDSFGSLSASVSRNGTLVYQLPTETPGGRLAWVERDGSARVISETVAPYLTPRLSADNRRLVHWGLGLSWNENSGIWSHDLERDHSMPLTIHKTGAAYPIWAPGERSVLYLKFESSGFSFRSIDSEGSGLEHVLFEQEHARLITSFAPDGESGLMYEVNPTTNRDIWYWSGSDEPRPLVATPFNERGGTISPDGKWFAYVSDQSGIDQVYVSSFPDGAGRWLVSNDGGTEPRWNPLGKELYYRVRDRMMAVFIEDEDGGFEAGAPVELFRGAFTSDPFGNANYDVSSDGKRFLMVQGHPITENSLMVVLNWAAELQNQ